ncbi:MAG: thioredoxin family protein [Alphaproteobacteria bacterium]
MHRSSFTWRLKALLLALAAAITATAAAPLQSLEPQGEKVDAKLVSEASAITPGETFVVALHFAIKNGWHTYWRFAGDSGAPTTIRWTLPEGFTASGIIWPLPKEVPLGPLMDYGFEHEAMHLVSISAPASLEPGQDVTFKASAEWLVCSDEVCIPRWSNLTLKLPVVKPADHPTADPMWGDRISAAVAALPVAAPFEVRSTIEGKQLSLSLHDSKLASDLKSHAVSNVTFFPYQDGVILHAAPQSIAVAKDGAALTTQASYLATSGRLPNPLHGLIVVAHDDGTRQGYEISATPGEMLLGAAPISANAKGNDSGSGIGMLGAIAFAFLGGLILNLMPCVFPVLSIKSIAFVKRDAEDHKALRLHGWLFTAGVLLSFLALDIVLIALRSGGAAIGWGYQLQSPLVVVLLAYVMFLVGLSMSGVLDIGAGWAGVGDSLARKPGALGAFFTGVLAAVVAAPCTAPFMSVALGYALLAPLAQGLLVFIALGIGLSLPFLVLAHVPRALAWLPKPGAWMERLKQILAIPMYAAAAWLLWVLSREVDLRGVLFALGGLALIAIGILALKFGRARSRLAARGAALVALLAACGLAALTQAETHNLKTPVKAAASDGDWSEYTPDRLSDAVAKGQPVFIDATAAWCLTCKVNELGALSGHRVREAFRAQNVLLLKADWTNRDAAITELLARNGRLGVPLYLYYPKASEGAAKILPQILTEDEVLAALKS